MVVVVVGVRVLLVLVVTAAVSYLDSLFQVFGQANVNHGRYLALKAEDDTVFAADLAAQAVNLLGEAGHLELLLLQNSCHVLFFAELVHLFLLFFVSLKLVFIAFRFT